MFSKFSSGSCGSCGSGRAPGQRDGNAPRHRPSYFNQVVDKLRNVADFGGLSQEALSEKAGELTEEGRLWSLYFSGVALDPARENIETKLEQGHVVEASRAKFIKVLFRPIRGGDRYGIQSFSSLLLEHYGALHASLLVGGAIVLEWSTAGLVIPTGKPVEPAPPTASVPPVGNSQGEPHEEPSAEQCAVFEQVIEHEFEVALDRKKSVDKLIHVILQYNKIFSYHPIHRNCQKFVYDCLVALGRPIPSRLAGTLEEYTKAVEKGRKRKIGFVAHSDLDSYVKTALETGSGMNPLETEYLLFQYFLFHVKSMTECEKPERWSCAVPGCLMPRLEQTIDLKATVAYHKFNTEQ